MCSLNWILVLTLAHLHYLAAAPACNRLKMNQLRTEIKNLRNTSCEGSKFYSPSNVEGNCTLPALNCAMRELKVAQNECFGNDTYRRSALKAEKLINSTLIKRPITFTDCMQCEGYKEKGYNEFIDDLSSLIIQLNVLNMC